MQAHMSDATRSKLAKLLPRLGPDHDGRFPADLDATVRQIDRTLKADGTDWHGLTETLTTTAIQDVPPIRRRRPRWRTQALQMAKLPPDIFSAREWDFVQTMAGLPPGCKASPKQKEWLKSLYARVQEGGAL